MAFIILEKIGEFGVCLHKGTPNFYVSAYLPEDGRMVYRSLHTTSVADACAQVRGLVDRCVTGDPAEALVQRPLRTVAEVLEFHRPTVEQQASADSGGIAIRRMTRLMGDQTMQAMVKSDFDRFRDAAMAEGISLSTVQRTLTVLRSACKQAADERRLPRHHVPAIPYYYTKNHARSAEPKGRVLTPREIAAIIDQVDFLHLLIALVYLVNTASRIGAVLDATAAQIYRDYGLIHLNARDRVQTDKWRPTLPVTATLEPWTRDLPDGFIVNYRGEKVSEIDTGFVAACRRAGLPGGENSYSVRHALGRFMQSQRVEPLEIALWLGHIQPPDSIETTRIYSPFRPDYLCNAKVAVEKFVREIASYTKRRNILTPPWST
jgi:integrase